MTDQQVCASTQKHNLDCWVRIMSSERVQNGVSLLGPDNESRKRPQNVDQSVSTHSGCSPFVRRFVATFGFCFRVRVHEGSLCSNLFKYVTQTSRAAVSGSHLGQPSRACFSGMLLGQPSRAGISGKHLGEQSRAAISGMLLGHVISGSHLGQASLTAISGENL